MAGHSKFKNIMHRKGAQDKKTRQNLWPVDQGIDGSGAG
jgi:transcriptional/translational regulatory protein YebC/TACO1